MRGKVFSAPSHGFGWDQRANRNLPAVVGPFGGGNGRVADDPSGTSPIFDLGPELMSASPLLATVEDIAAISAWTCHFSVVVYRSRNETELQHLPSHSDIRRALYA